MNNIINDLFIPSQSFVRLMKVSPDEDELRIYRDKKGIIKIINLRDKWIYLKTVVKRISVNCPNYNMFLKNSFFPVNQTLSSKMSSFIRYYKINEMVDSQNQFAFAVIERINGESILIRPFKPKKVNSKWHHAEPQCIPPIREYVKKNKSVIKGIYIFTKLSPCLCIDSECDPCMIQLARFSEEMFYDYNIDVYITFQDMYGASRDRVKQLTNSSHYEDTFIRNIVLELKEMFNKKLRTLEFTVKLFQRNQRKDTSTTVKSYIKEMLACNLKQEDVSRVLKAISVQFPSKPMTLYEFKNYGKRQVNKIRITQKILDVCEETVEEICVVFYSKWCQIVYEEYEKFIYEKLGDYINTFAVAFAYKDIKAITSHFNLERVVVTL